MTDYTPEENVVSTRYVRAETPRLYQSPHRGAIGEGWAPLVEVIFGLLDLAAPGWVLTQVKQDLGRLDVHYDVPKTADPPRVRAARNAITAIAEMAAVTCEICSAPGRQTVVNGWLSIFCDQHARHTGLIPVVRYLTGDAQPPRRAPSDAERQHDRELNERIRAAAANADFSEGPADPDAEIMRRALDTPWQPTDEAWIGEPQDLVAAVRDLLGSKLVAYLADTSTPTVRRWADPADPATPPPDVTKRLHVAHRIATSITRHDSPAVAQAWFLGSAADGTAPARRIREGNPRDVEPELIARIADTLGRPPSPLSGN